MADPTRLDGVVTVRAIEGRTELVRPGSPPPWGWVINEPYPGQAHLLPTWDTGEHAAWSCRCGPTLDASGMVVHNAFDGRERYEKDGAPRN